MAEKANVRLAVHPNDPPPPLYRGTEQILGSVDGLKRVCETVRSPANGITFDTGVTREMGYNVIENIKWFGGRDQINHVHFRNVLMKVPREKYVETFIDEGDNDMFAVMKELVRLKYRLQIYPEHPRALDYDQWAGIRSQYPGGGGYAGFAYNVGYTRAMLQAALTT